MRCSQTSPGEARFTHNKSDAGPKEIYHHQSAEYSWHLDSAQMKLRREMASFNSKISELERELLVERNPGNHIYGEDKHVEEQRQLLHLALKGTLDPFSLGEKPGFDNFPRYVSPRYSSPSRDIELEGSRILQGLTEESSVSGSSRLPPQPMQVLVEECYQPDRSKFGGYSQYASKPADELPVITPEKRLGTEESENLDFSLNEIHDLLNLRMSIGGEKGLNCSKFYTEVQTQTPQNQEITCFWPGNGIISEDDQHNISFFTRRQKLLASSLTATSDPKSVSSLDDALSRHRLNLKPNPLKTLGVQRSGWLSAGPSPAISLASHS